MWDCMSFYEAEILKTCPFSQKVFVMNKESSFSLYLQLMTMT